MIDIESLSPSQKELAITIGDNAVKAGIDPDLAIAQAFTESRLNHFVGEGKGRHVIKSDQDAYGVMQITPALAKAYGYSKEDLLNPIKNVQAYTEIMKNYLTKYGSPDLAIMAYHQGEGPVDKYLKTNDLKHIGPKGKEYLQLIGEHYDFTGEGATSEDKTEAEKIIEEGGIRQQEPPKPEPKSFTESVKEMAQPVIDVATENPEATTYGVLGGVGQSMINKGMRDANIQKGMDRTAQDVRALEEQFRASQVAPNADRILQGRTEEGLTGRQRQSYNDITSARAAQARQQQQVLDELARRGQIEPDYRPRIMSQAMPTESTPSGVLYSGQRLNEEQRRMIQEADKNKSAIQRAREYMASKSVPSFAKIGGLGATRFLGPLSTGVMTANTVRELERSRELELKGDLLGSRIARFNAIASGLGAIPTTPFAPLNVLKGIGMVGTGAGSLVEAGRDRFFPYKSVTQTPK